MPSLPIIPYQGAPAYLGMFAQGGSWSAWNVPMLVFALIMFFAVTFVYMLAMAFNLQSVRQWCKSEYMQVVATFLIVGTIVAITAVLWPMMITAIIHIYNVANPYDPTFRGIGSGVITQGQMYADPFNFSVHYINNTMLYCQKTVYRTAYGLNMMFEFYQTMSNEPIGTEPLGGWYASVYTGTFKYIAANAANAMIFNYVQIRFLQIIKYAMPPLMLLGFVLRAFAPTRGAGGLMLATGLGFFFVYPISTAMLMLLSPFPDVAFCNNLSPPPAIDPAKQTAITMLNGGERLYFLSGIESEMGSITQLGERLKNFIPVFYLQAAFFPLVSLIVTFTFIRQTGALFGADLNEIGRGLIKLI